LTITIDGVFYAPLGSYHVIITWSMNPCRLDSHDRGEPPPACPGDRSANDADLIIYYLLSLNGPQPSVLARERTPTLLNYRDGLCKYVDPKKKKNITWSVVSTTEH